MRQYAALSRVVSVVGIHDTGSTVDPTAIIGLLHLVTALADYIDVAPCVLINITERVWADPHDWSILCM